MTEPLPDLSLPQLQEIRQAFLRELQLGLVREGQSLACLPAYLSPPAPGLKGQALVVDAGGTNVRAALVELGRDQPLLAGPSGALLPDGRSQPVSREQFFAAQAHWVHSLGASTDLPLGYCFSYPAAIQPDGDAILLRWTKGIKVEGVVGQRVGQALRQAVGGSGPVKVLNDTVACLLGGAYWAGPSFDNFIGLIVGTGTNMASFVPTHSIAKLPLSTREGQMALNLESGNFHPPQLSVVDDQLDQESDNPGLQRFEKAVSGIYLPQLLSRLCPDLNFGPEASSEAVVELAGQGLQPAQWLLDRSADLVAAALAGLRDQLPQGRLAIQAEGGLFWKAPSYAPRVQSTLSRLLGSDKHFQILHGQDVNLIGAAVAALSRSA